MKLKPLIFIAICGISSSKAYTQVITTFAGNHTFGIGGDGGPATQAQFNEIKGITIDKKGNVYICELATNGIRVVDTFGIIRTFAGNHVVGYSGDGGAATSAQLSRPSRITTDNFGKAYIVDQDGLVIRKVDPSGIITTYAGNGKSGYSGDGGPAINATFGLIESATPDNLGNIYISDALHHVIRKIDANGIITTIAGNGKAGYSGDGGPAINAQLSIPWELDIDKYGNIYIPEEGNLRIRMINNAGIISTIAGNGTQGYSGDGGDARLAQFNAPLSVRINSTTGDIYITDNNNYVVRKINSSGIISTYAGKGTYGYSGDGGPASLAQLSEVEGVAVDSLGNLFITDNLYNVVVRKVTPCVLMAPVSGTASLCTGSTNSLQDPTPGGTWSSSDNTIASINSNGAITGVSAGNVTIRYTFNQGSCNVSALFPVTVNAYGTVSPITGTTSVCEGSNTSLSDATAGGVWSSSDNTIASINSNGVVTGIKTGTANISYTISNSCGTSSSNQTVTVKATPSIQPISGASSVCTGSAVALSDATPGGVWSSSDNTIASVNSNGIVTGISGGTASINYSVSGQTCNSNVSQHIKIFPSPAVALASSATISQGGSVTLMPQYSGTGLSFLWAPSSYLNNNTSSSPVSTPPNDITYTLTVTDTNGCFITDTILITVLKAPVIPNAFSPNGDGVNDTWEIKYLSSYPGASVQLYNRSGQLIFSSIGYAHPWDGTYNGKPVPIGTYYYIINPKNGQQAMSGSVTVIR